MFHWGWARTESKEALQVAPGSGPELCFSIHALRNAKWADIKPIGCFVDVIRFFLQKIVALTLSYFLFRLPWIFAELIYIKFPTLCSDT